MCSRLGRNTGTPKNVINTLVPDIGNEVEKNTTSKVHKPLVLKYVKTETTHLINATYI